MVKKKKAKQSLIYLLHCEATDRYKIGITSHLKQRVNTLSNQGGFPLAVLIEYTPCNSSARYIENALHIIFSGFRIRGEYFMFSGMTREKVSSMVAERMKTLDRHMEKVSKVASAVTQSAVKSINEEYSMNLSKVVAGERINLSKAQAGVNKYAVGLEWNPKAGVTADCDISIILLDANGKVIPGTNGPNKPKCMCYYGQLELPGVKSYGDNQDGSDDAFATPTGNDEQIDIDLSKLSADVAQVVVVASTHSETGTALPFGRVASPVLTIFANEGARPDPKYFFEMDEDFSTATSVEVAKFYRRGADWSYVSMADVVGTDAMGLQGIVSKYGITS